MEISPECPLQTTTLIYDRKNNRVDGIHGPKRRKTMDQRFCTCSFCFLVKWQLGVGFFIELDKCAGESFHCFHAKVLDPSSISFPARLLTIEQVQNTLDVVNATSNNGAGRNYLRLSIGKFVSLVKIAYLSQKANGKYQSTDNGIEHMISNFKDSNEISFISFSDVPIQEYIEGKVDEIMEETTQMSMDDNTTVTVCTHKQDDNNITFTEINDENL